MANEKDEERGISSAELRQLQRKVQDHIIEEIVALDPEAVTELSINARVKSNFFSDWNDKFRDGGTFSDAWGKAGDKSGIKARISPAEMIEIPNPAINPKGLPEK